MVEVSLIHAAYFSTWLEQRLVRQSRQKGLSNWRSVPKKVRTKVITGGEKGDLFQYSKRPKVRRLVTSRNWLLPPLQPCVHGNNT